MGGEFFWLLLIKRMVKFGFWKKVFLIILFIREVKNFLKCYVGNWEKIVFFLYLILFYELKLFYIK